ncbi:MAG: DUF47 domain-containing protein [Vampirovibrionales bacterium]
MKFLNFLPQEDKFYDLIDTLAVSANNASDALHQALQPGNEAKQADYYKALATTRQQAKKALNTLQAEVCRTFITPFDREDLQELAEALYNISSCLDVIGTRIRLHDLKLLDGDFLLFTHICSKQAEVLLRLIKGLNSSSQPSTLQEQVTVLYELEDQGDRALLELEVALFNRQPTPSIKDVVVRRDIYAQFESVTDGYRDAATIALRILLKHS